MAPHIRSHTAPCSCFPKRCPFSCRQNSPYMWCRDYAAGLEESSTGEVPSRGCKSAVVITAECSRHHASRNVKSKSVNTIIQWTIAIVNTKIHTTLIRVIVTVIQVSSLIDKKLSYRRGTARCVVSIEILPIAAQQCRNYLYDKSWPNRWYEVGDLVGGNAW